MHRIAEKLRADYVAQIGYIPGPYEVANGQNTLMALSMLVDQAEVSPPGNVIPGRSTN